MDRQCRRRVDDGKTKYMIRMLGTMLHRHCLIMHLAPFGLGSRSSTPFQDLAISAVPADHKALCRSSLCRSASICSQILSMYLWPGADPFQASRVEDYSCPVVWFLWETHLAKGGSTCGIGRYKRRYIICSLPPLTVISLQSSKQSKALSDLQS